MKGILLAGGIGSRLHPLTLGISKQLLPVYNKPLIYYPLSTLMLADIREVLIITAPEHLDSIRKTVGDGTSLGMSISYELQSSPKGIVEAFIIGKRFIGTDSVALILGDNIFYGQGLGQHLRNFNQPEGAHIFAYKVSDPRNYGVAGFDQNGKLVSITEKPSAPASNFAVTGLYFYDNSVVEMARKVSPSPRGELEITSLNNLYLELHFLQATILKRGTTWLDAGTFDALFSASAYIRSLEERQGLRIACLEEIAWRNGWIENSKLIEIVNQKKDSNEARYLLELLEER